MRYLFVLSFALFHMGLYAQLEPIVEPEEEEEGEPLDFAKVDRYPIPSGCEAYFDSPSEDQAQCMQTYIRGVVADNFKFPSSARNAGVGVRYYINFVIEKNGRVSNVHLPMSASDKFKDGTKSQKKGARDLDKEAIRVVKLLRFIEPAMVEGKPV